MKISLALCALSLSFSFNALAADAKAPALGWLVLAVRGQAQVGGKKAVVGEPAPEQAVVQTAAKGLVKLASAGGVVAVVGPDSNVTLSAPQMGSQGASKADSPQTLGTVAKGMVRWLVKKRPDADISAAPFVVRTSNAVMGIRGTDFLAIANPLLGESEILCFHGSVLFSAAADAKNVRAVGANQWGGLGGRFGKTIAPVLNLPPNVIAAFRAQSEIKTQAVGATPRADLYGEELPAGL